MDLTPRRNTDRRELLRASGVALGALAFGPRTFAREPDRRPFSFVVLGDTHFARRSHYDFRDESDKGVVEYADAMCANTAEGWDGLWEEVATQLRGATPGPSFVLQLGDYVHGDCTTPEKASAQYRDFVRDLERRRLPVPLYLTRGNHELQGRGVREAYERSMPGFLAKAAPPSRGVAHYSFDAGPDAHFAVLDVFGTQAPAKSRPFLSAAQLSWLGADLAAFRRRSPRGRLFVATHAPHFLVSSFDALFGTDPAGHAALTDLLIRQRVDAIFCGHLHVYSRLHYTDPASGHVISQLMTYSIMGKGEVRETPPAEKAYTPDLIEPRASRSDHERDAMRSVVRLAAPRVSGFRVATTPGYQIVTVDTDGTTRVDSYQGLGRRRYESFTLPNAPTRRGAAPSPTPSRS